MFTIKNVNKDVSRPKDAAANSVRLWEGKDVYFGLNDNGGSPTVSFSAADGSHLSIDHGVVFIMNQNGKTVDTFLLNGSEWY